MKVFNVLSLIGGMFGGLIASVLGGFDKILIGLIIVIVLDYLTGLIKGIVTKKLSSAVGFKGLLKKILILIVVAVAVVIESIVGEVIPLREVVIMFFICNEAISLLENASEFIPIPEKLKSVLIQLRDKNDNQETK